MPANVALAVGPCRQSLQPCRQLCQLLVLADDGPGIQQELGSLAPQSVLEPAVGIVALLVAEAVGVGKCHHLLRLLLQALVRLLVCVNHVEHAVNARLKHRTVDLQ